jgi:hypothetical protein
VNRAISGLAAVVAALAVSRPGLAGKVSGGRVALKLSCAGAPCTGTLRVASAAKVKQGKRKRTVTVTRAIRYSRAQGATMTPKPKLTSVARSLLLKGKLVVRVTTAPIGGDALAGKLTLARLGRVG